MNFGKMMVPIGQSFMGKNWIYQLLIEWEGL